MVPAPDHTVLIAWLTVSAVVAAALVAAASAYLLQRRQLKHDRQLGDLAELRSVLDEAIVALEETIHHLQWVFAGFGVGQIWQESDEAVKEILKVSEPAVQGWTSRSSDVGLRRASAPTVFAIERPKPSTGANVRIMRSAFGPRRLPSWAQRLPWRTARRPVLIAASTLLVVDLLVIGLGYAGIPWPQGTIVLTFVPLFPIFFAALLLASVRWDDVWNSTSGTRRRLRDFVHGMHPLVIVACAIGFYGGCILGAVNLPVHGQPQ